MFNNYPYTDLHELNLDWILRKVKELDVRIDTFVALNTITMAGIWDITESYVKYAIVEHNGDGYMSLQPVPAGIDITNTDYWFKLYDYTAIENDVEKLKIALNNDLKTRKTVFIGDSYQVGTNNNDVSFLDYIIQYTGLTTDNYARIEAGGYGFAKPGAQFVTLLETIAASMTAEERATFTDLVVTGGFNDHAYQTTLAYNIEVFADRAKTLFPNAKYWIVPMGYSTLSTIHDKFSTIYTIYQSAGSENGFTVVKPMKDVLKYPGLMGADEIHPTNRGQELLAYYLLTVLNYGGCYVNYAPSGQTISVGSLWTQSSMDIYEIQNGNTVRVISDSPYRLDAVTPTSYSANGSTYIEIGDLPNKAPFGFENANANFVTVNTIIQDGAWKNMQGFLSVKGGKLYLSFYSGTGGFENVTPSIIYLPPFMLDVTCGD